MELLLNCRLCLFEVFPSPLTTDYIFHTIKHWSKQIKKRKNIGKVDKNLLHSRVQDSTQESWKLTCYYFNLLPFLG